MISPVLNAKARVEELGMVRTTTLSKYALNSQ